MKLLLFIATKKGYDVMKTIYQYDPKIIGLVTTFNEINVLDSYSEKIMDFCQKNKLNFFKWSEFKNNVINYIQKNKITEAIAIGFRYVLPIAINSYMNHDLFIFHDSLLPRFRGFAPTPTAILKGEREIGMTILYATENIDNGSIIIQKKHSIDDSIYIKDAIDIQCELYKEAVIDLIEAIKKDKIISVPQKEEEATYSIWRNPEDCLIDWKKENIQILNLIRAVSYPYPGAYTYINSKKVIVWKATCVDDLNFEIRDTGKIWKIDDKHAIVVCGKGMLKLHDVTDEIGNKIEFTKLRVKLG